MGFSQQRALEAYFIFQKDLEAAASPRQLIASSLLIPDYLFSTAEDDMDIDQGGADPEGVFVILPHCLYLSQVLPTSRFFLVELNTARSNLPASRYCSR